MKKLTFIKTEIYSNGKVNTLMLNVFDIVAVETEKNKYLMEPYDNLLISCGITVKGGRTYHVLHSFDVVRNLLFNVGIKIIDRRL